MRVLLALGGNAMTERRRAAPAPEDQIAAAEVAMAAVAELVAARRRRRGHPRQRPPGRQPAGQERARRGRRTAGAAGLVRRPDPGDARLRADGRARRRAAPRAASTGARADRGHPHPGRRRRPRLHPADQADRALPAGRRGRACSSSTARPGRTAARRAGAGSSPRPSRSRSSTPPAVQALVEAGFVVVANGGGGIPVVRDDDGALRGVEAVIDKDLGAALLARTVDGRRARHRHRRAARRAALRHPRGRAARPGRRRARCGRSPPRATSPAARWARRSTRSAGSSSRAAPAPSSPTSTTSSTRSTGDAGTVVVPD